MFWTHISYHTCRADDWCIEGKNNTLSFPSYYIDENVSNFIAWKFIYVNIVILSCCQSAHQESMLKSAYRISLIFEDITAPLAKWPLNSKEYNLLYIESSLWSLDTCRSWHRLPPSSFLWRCNVCNFGTRVKQPDVRYLLGIWKNCNLLNFNFLAEHQTNYDWIRNLRKRVLRLWKVRSQTFSLITITTSTYICPRGWMYWLNNLSPILQVGYNPEWSLLSS